MWIRSSENVIAEKNMIYSNSLDGLFLSDSTLVLIYGGTCYVFSSGDTQKTENAKKTVKYALLGIFVVGISFAIITILDMIFH